MIELLRRTVFLTPGEVIEGQKSAYVQLPGDGQINNTLVTHIGVDLRIPVAKATAPHGSYHVDFVGKWGSITAYDNDSGNRFGGQPWDSDPDNDLTQKPGFIAPRQNSMNGNLFWVQLSAPGIPDINDVPQALDFSVDLVFYGADV